jgi:hypothetical protein
MNIVAMPTPTHTFDKESLNATLDALADGVFFGKQPPQKDIAAALQLVCDRQGQPGSYAGMFAPTEADRAGIRLFTGERVKSNAGIGHQLGEEACRVLNLLKKDVPETSAALERAVAGMTAWLAEYEARGYDTCVYCCGTCSPAYWRNLATGLFPKAEERLSGGMKRLSELHTGDGQWSKFPFFFTSLALTEIDPSLARGELRYAAARWERIMPRLARSGKPYDVRRAEVGKRLLGMV